MDDVDLDQEDIDPDDFDDGPVRISVTDQRGRALGVVVQGDSAGDMLPPADRGGEYALVRRRSRF